jgi:hypothetical protein
MAPPAKKARKVQTPGSYRVQPVETPDKTKTTPVKTKMMPPPFQEDSSGPAKHPQTGKET